MLDKLKIEVCMANKQLVDYGLVMLTWGNVSSVDRGSGLMVIKPSGIDYKDLVPELMVVVNLESGKIEEGSMEPSSDTATHLELYRAFNTINSIVHTHSTFATVWSQARMPIPALGTTHADTFYGEVPCTRMMTEQEINSYYEKETGKVIIETIGNKDPLEVPAILVAGHGPFAWGSSPLKAVQNAAILEEVARMAYYTSSLNAPQSIPQVLLDKHYNRKHGANAYYGQNKKNTIVQ